MREHERKEERKHGRKIEGGSREGRNGISESEFASNREERTQIKNVGRDE